MPVWGQVTWIMARSGGFVAYALLALAVIEGLTLSLRWQHPIRWPRLINNEMHQYLTLLALFFTVIHGLAVWIDPFTTFKPVEVLVPFLAHYRPIWVGLGIVSFYLGIAVALSFYLRPKFGYAWWKKFHYFTYLVFILATLHGIATGSDTRTTWALAIYGVSSGMILFLTVLRLVRPKEKDAKPAYGYAAACVALALFGLSWTMAGPLKSGWNVIANNGHGSGGKVNVASPVNSSIMVLPLTSAFQGTVSANGPDGNGVVTLKLQTQLQSSGTLDILLQGFLVEDGGLEVTTGKVLLADTQGHVYQGRVTTLRGSHLVALLASSSSSPKQIQATVDLGTLDLQSGTVSGQIVAITGNANSTSSTLSP